MDAIFFEFVFNKEILFSCECGWVGCETELDVLSNSSINLVCCPSCKNDDVRIFNENKVD